MAKPLSLLVEISGPDPKGRKAEGQIFSAARDGTLRISASGCLLRRVGSAAQVVCPATLISPFLHPSKRGQLGTCSASSLAPLVSLTVGLQGHTAVALLQGFFEIPEVAAEVQRLHTSGWVWAWRLKQGSDLNRSHTEKAWIAVLSCTLPSKATEEHEYEVHGGPLPQQGEALQCMGSPFGSLAPRHFAHCLTTGVAANTPDHASGSFFLADMQCLPGMEGAPVCSSDRIFLGVLMQPLSHAHFDSEMPVVIAAAPLLTAFKQWSLRLSGSTAAPSLQDAQPKRSASEIWPSQQSQRSHIRRAEPSLGFQTHVIPTTDLAAQHGRQSSTASQLRRNLTAAQDAVVAISSSGSWASGIVVSQSGVVLTVAHAVDVGPDSRQQGGDEAGPARHSSSKDGALGRSGSQRGVRVRLRDTVGPGFRWCDAEVVHVFRGALDLAVLQLSNPGSLVSTQLCSFDLIQGQPIYVVGHGLFNPRLHMQPSVTAGVISKLVTANLLSKAEQAVMLITTAAVYPGASGGAVVNPSGQVVGLVTSNTKHAASGRSLPRLNYSIAAAALEPLWKLLQQPVDPARLAALDVQSAELKAIWSLATPPSVFGATTDRTQGADRLAELLQQSGVLPGADAPFAGHSRL